MLNGKAALVTNVMHFVGSAAARALQQQGARVFCHDMSFTAKAARDAFCESVPNVTALAETSAHETIAAVENAAGSIEILVCNDFFPAIRAPVDEAKTEDLRASLDALVVVPFEFAAAAAARMKPRRSGKIILVTSAAPFHGLPNYSMYATARGAANSMALSLAKELAGANIQVNAVAPNYVESPSYFPKSLIENPAAMKKFTEKVPLKRLGQPEEVAAAIAFFASTGSDFITGHVLPVAGGWA
ncbi:MAG: SDR family oxidoreductase [Rhodobacteraceae bacterium]|nr:SDR family oxidoreductase [Paracoccaceae bacterium]